MFSLLSTKKRNTIWKISKPLKNTNRTLTNSSDIGVFRLYLISGLQNQIDVGGARERRRDRAGNPAGGPLVALSGEAEILSLQRRSHQPLPILGGPHHGRETLGSAPRNESKIDEEP